MASSTQNSRGLGEKGEDKMMSSLSHSLQRAWPSDKNMVRSLRNENMDLKAQETKVMSGLLRKASMLCKPGGGVDPSHKALMKDLVLSNDQNIQAALDLSSTGQSEELNRYLALLSREKTNPERASEATAERRELIRNWQQKLKLYEKSKEANGVDARAHDSKRDALEREKMRISKGLGSKRSRPGSMMRLTSFRDNQRGKVVEEANAAVAADANNQTMKKESQAGQSPVMNSNGSGSVINGTTQPKPADMFASFAQAQPQSQQLHQQQLAQQQQQQQQQLLSGLVNQGLSTIPHGLQGTPGMPANFMGLPNTAGAAGIPMLNPLQLQALQAQALNGMQPMFGNPGFAFEPMNNQKLMDALALQQKQQLAQQLQLQQLQLQMQAGNQNANSMLQPNTTSLSAAAAAVQAQAQAQEAFRQANPSSSFLPGSLPTVPKTEGLSQPSEKDKIRVQRMMLRREKKSKRERQRRLVLNTLYDELGSMLFDNNLHETKDRATILQSAIEYLNKSCGIAIPSSSLMLAEEEMAMNEKCIYPNCESAAVEGKDCCFVHDGKGRKASHLTAEERLMRRRGKKSKREKQRRHNVNVLSERLGEMLKVTECKDKTTVLNVAIQYLRKHPRKKGEKVSAAKDSHKTVNRSPASLKTGISFLRASQQ